MSMKSATHTNFFPPSTPNPYQTSTQTSALFNCTTRMEHRHMLKKDWSSLTFSVYKSLVVQLTLYILVLNCVQLKLLVDFHGISHRSIVNQRIHTDGVKKCSLQSVKTKCCLWVRCSFIYMASLMIPTTERTFSGHEQHTPSGNVNNYFLGGIVWQPSRVPALWRSMSQLWFQLPKLVFWHAKIQLYSTCASQATTTKRARWCSYKTAVLRKLRAKQLFLANTTRASFLFAIT